MRSKNTGARKALENVIHLVFLLCGIVAVGFVLVISVYLIISGLPAIRQIGLFKFLFGQVWDPTNTTTGAQYGILPFILTSIYGTAGAMVIGVPIGLMTAIFLAKLAPPRAASVIRTAVQLLAGIKGDWRPIGSVLFGNASVIEFNMDAGTFETLLYVQEDTSDTKEQLEAKLDNPDEIILDRICDEVFGDG